MFLHLCGPAEQLGEGTPSYGELRSQPCCTNERLHHQSPEFETDLGSRDALLSPVTCILFLIALANRTRENPCSGFGEPLLCQVSWQPQGRGVLLARRLVATLLCPVSFCPGLFPPSPPTPPPASTLSHEALAPFNPRPGICCLRPGSSRGRQRWC